MQLSRDELLSAYQTMKTIRVFEDRVNQEMGSGDIPGAVHLYAGQEASAVGICSLLDSRDQIASTHRGHGHCIAKGCDVPGMMAEIFGKQNGLCLGKGGSMHIADLEKGMMGANGIVGGGPPMICGAALSAKILGTKGVAVAFAGDGAFNQGTTQEALNLASIWQLPVVFAIEDNGFAEATSSEYAVAGDIVKRAQAYDIASEKVDGLNFFEVHIAAKSAIERAREGLGPSLLQIKTERYYGHFSGDADTYRSDEEKSEMRQNKDCLKIFRNKVIGSSLLNEEQLNDIDQKVIELIDHAVKFAREGAKPNVEGLTKDVYLSY